MNSWAKPQVDGVANGLYEGVGFHNKKSPIRM